MSGNTSVHLGEHFDAFIEEQIRSGRSATASEVILTALRLFEQEESRKNELVNALKEGEASGLVQNFDKEEFLKTLHRLQ